MTSLAEQLSNYASSLRYEDLPEETVHLAKRFVIDTLGCALGGYSSETARVAREMAGMVSSTAPVTVMGSGQQSSLDLTSFANGVAIRYLDFNDGYTSRESGHPSDSIAASLSATEAAGASGKDVHPLDGAGLRGLLPPVRHGGHQAAVRPRDRRWGGQYAGGGASTGDVAGADAAGVEP